MFCHNDKSMKFTGESVCGDCHGDIKKQVSANPVKDDCLLCHAPHSWKSNGKVCSSCHDVAKQGLHSVEVHTDCTACHIQHQWKPSGREDCLSCHTDKKDHNYPDLCWSCHPFK
jgi:hypothetical protein